jgi:hypothetical protein
MWEPRIAVEGWAWFTAAYLAGIVAVIAIVTVVAVGGLGSGPAVLKRDGDGGGR